MTNKLSFHPAHEGEGGFSHGAVELVARALAVELAGAEVDVLRKQKKKEISQKMCPPASSPTRRAVQPEASSGTRLPRQGFR